jgi:hypothetical protein
MTHRELLSEVFAELERQYGFTTVTDGPCCQSCTWADIPADAADVAFYHEEDAKSFDLDGHLTQPLYLAHRGRAELLVYALLAAGFGVDWNGLDGQRIEITAPPRAEER